MTQTVLQYFCYCIMYINLRNDNTTWCITYNILLLHYVLFFEIVTTSCILYCVFELMAMNKVVIKLGNLRYFIPSPLKPLKSSGVHYLPLYTKKALSAHLTRVYINCIQFISLFIFVHFETH
jgi:hypothetical protein